MVAIKSLLPFETLEDAAKILNQICREKQVEGHFAVRTFLSLAINGGIKLSVDLPEEFRVARKNLEAFDNTPIRPRFPAGSTHCFITKNTAFKLSRRKSTLLDAVFTISNEGVKDDYYSAKPYMSITIADLMISDDELIKCINSLYSSTTHAPSNDEERSTQRRMPEAMAGTENEVVADHNRIKQRQQEQAILAFLNERYSDLKKLPKSPEGKPGLPAAAWKALKGSPLFNGRKTILEKAWARLLQFEEIKYDEETALERK